MTHEFNTLLESVLSWIVTADHLPDAPQGGFNIDIGLLRSLADAWEKERASMRMALAALTNDPYERHPLPVFATFTPFHYTMDDASGPPKTTVPLLNYIAATCEWPEQPRQRTR
jgi:hypothetical protein